ncbi:MAG: hypothetical protein ACREMJ_07160 [Gemmatimonadales bacterium]
MRGLWLFVHFIGFTLWLGAGMGAMAAGVTAKRFAPGDRLAVYRALGALHRFCVFPGALFTIVSGFALLGPFMGAGMTGGLTLMMLAGTIGGLVAAFGSVPTAMQLARLELDARGELPESFQGLRKRQVIVATIAGGLGLIALAGATFFRY